MIKVLTQAWRVLRIFAVTLGAQLAAQGVSVNHLTEKVIIAAFVAAAEATYRQVVPVKDQSKSVLTNLLAAYNLIKNAAEVEVKAEAKPAAAPAPAVVAPHPAGSTMADVAPPTK